VLREKLGISGFRDSFSFKNKDQYVVQHMVSYTFPHNLERMEKLVRELRIEYERLALEKPEPLPDGEDLPEEPEQDQVQSSQDGDDEAQGDQESD
jgi:hypothetical protein